jgi:hypothetical protein
MPVIRSYKTAVAASGLPLELGDSIGTKGIKGYLYDYFSLTF